MPGLPQQSHPFEFRLPDVIGGPARRFDAAKHAPDTREWTPSFEISGHGRHCVNEAVVPPKACARAGAGWPDVETSGVWHPCGTVRFRPPANRAAPLVAAIRRLAPNPARVPPRHQDPLRGKGRLRWRQGWRLREAHGGPSRRFTREGPGAPPQRRVIIRHGFDRLSTGIQHRPGRTVYSDARSTEWLSAWIAISADRYIGLDFADVYTPWACEAPDVEASIGGDCTLQIPEHRKMRPRLIWRGDPHPCRSVWRRGAGSRTFAHRVGREMASRSSLEGADECRRGAGSPRRLPIRQRSNLAAWGATPPSAGLHRSTRLRVVATASPVRPLGRGRVTGKNDARHAAARLLAVGEHFLATGRAT